MILAAIGDWTPLFLVLIVIAIGYTVGRHTDGKRERENDTTISDGDK